MSDDNICSDLISVKSLLNGNLVPSLLSTSTWLVPLKYGNESNKACFLVFLLNKVLFGFYSLIDP